MKCPFCDVEVKLEARFPEKDPDLIEVAVWCEQPGCTYEAFTFLKQKGQAGEEGQCDLEVWRG